MTFSHDAGPADFSPTSSGQWSTRGISSAGILSVELEGEITRANTSDLKAWFAEQLQLGSDSSEICAVEVHCARLSYLDSTGLGCLIACRKAAVDAGKSFWLSGVNGWLQKFLLVTGLESLFAAPDDAPGTGE